VQRFAAAYLAGQACRTGWDQVGGQDIEHWMVHLLGRYCSAYASNRYRGLSTMLRLAHQRCMGSTRKVHRREMAAGKPGLWTMPDSRAKRWEGPKYKSLARGPGFQLSMGL
jgi:hypothetical protein